MATKTFDIMFDDLVPEAQRRLLQWQGGIDTAEEGNYDVMPVAMIEWEDPFEAEPPETETKK